ncbi:hypothetical protein LUQ84_002412 [Hamiltosporidium tvaerminnensis]|nr:hypothetical protein LUQ84_002412 [Hamiltosporidium tvaerminnensis]
MEDRNTIFIIVGMAGSGKSTFCSTLLEWIHEKYRKEDLDTEEDKYDLVHTINLDPATLSENTYTTDIRDTINYTSVMQKHELGPNGGILTSLNLYLLEFHKIMDKFTEKFIIIDTPGQIEAFTWSSPGMALVSLLKNIGSTDNGEFKPLYDIKLLYIIDAPLSHKHDIFMSNMLYAVSLKCRFDLETICVFNKIDLSEDTENIIEWIRDYEKFRESLPEDEMNTPILSSMCLYFEEFYKNVKCACVSSLDGTGKEDFFRVVFE